MPTQIENLNYDLKFSNGFTQQKKEVVIGSKKHHLKHNVPQCGFNLTAALRIYRFSFGNVTQLHTSAQKTSSFQFYGPPWNAAGFGCESTDTCGRTAKKATTPQKTMESFWSLEAGFIKLLLILFTLRVKRSQISIQTFNLPRNKNCVQGES